MQLLELDFVSLPLCLLSLLVLNLRLLVGLLGPDLIKSCSAILSLLLHLSHALDFKLLFLLEALIFQCLRLFSLQGPPEVISDLLIKVHFGLPGSSFLRKGVLIGDFDLIIHDLNPSRLLLLDLYVLQLHFLNVGFQLGLLKLKHFLLLLSLNLSRGDLVNEDLGAAFTGSGCSFLSLVLGLECFQALNFHHHVKSFLFVDPVLLQLLVLLELLISDCVDP